MGDTTATVHVSGLTLSPIQPLQLFPRTQSAKTANSPQTPDVSRPADQTSISVQARELLASERGTNDADDGTASGGDELSDGEKQQVRELQTRDREVRAHEAAHKAAAGNLATGGATFTYQTGPDGKRYAVGGEVQIQTGKGRTPEETLAKAQQVAAAANAPANPSAQDRKVAAEAARLASEARRELQTGEQAGRGGEDHPRPTPGTPEGPDTDLLLRQMGLTV